MATERQSKTFTELVQTESNQHHKAIFSILAGREADGLTADGQGCGKELVLDASEVDNIRDELYGVVTDARPGTCTLDEMKSSLKLKITEKLENLKEYGLTKDGYFNPVSGIGTLIDPGMYTETFTPVSLTPQEATGYYVSGGIPARIIDKKAGTISLDGVQFECADLDPDDLLKLQEYAEKCGFNQAYRDAATFALIYGGGVAYPVLQGDTPLNSDKSINTVLKEIPAEKDFIRWWVTADRWSVVFVPDYNITAKDYLYARTIFVPLGGVRVNTERVAMVRPKRLPFWGAIQQLGWSTSDFEGWIKDYEAYQIMKQSLPIMAQQMSLMYHHIPADGLILENGPEAAKDLFKLNEQQMREWSMLHPKAFNSVGEIKILERTYSGYQQLISEAKLAVAAGAGVPESLVFQDKPTGLASDRQEDVTLKQSEGTRILFNNVAPAMKPCIKLLVMSCFGKNSEQAKHADKVTIKADSGVVLSDQDKAQLGQTFATIMAQLVSLGVPMDAAVDLAHNMVPSVDIDADLMARLGQEPAEGAGGFDQDMWNDIQANLGQEGMQQ